MTSEEKPAPEPPAPRPKRDPFTLFLVVACVALAVLVLFLARQNRQLKASLAEAMAGGLPADVLKAGDRVEPFDVLADSGEKSRIAFEAGGPRTLILVFSLHCPACERTIPLWNDVLSVKVAPSLRVIGLQTDKRDPASGPEPILFSSLRFPVFGIENPGPPALGRLPGVPSAVLLDSHGLVVKTWFGLPTKQQLEDLRREIAG